MGLGLNTGGANGADIVPHIRYDARAGRLFRAERSQGADGRWATELVDISQPPPVFLMDLARIEVGWMSYSNGAPDLRMSPFGAPLPPQPGPEHKQGFRVRVYAQKLLGGVREFASSAKAVIAAVDALHTAFEAAPERGLGLVPVVSLAGATAVTTKTPQGSSTNYAPVFRIEKWLPRPAELEPAAATAVAPPKHVPPPATQAAQVPPPPPPIGAPAHATEF